MSEGDTFREQAEEARKMAARSLSEADKAFWLGVAEDRAAGGRSRRRRKAKKLTLL
jgi:hypothetical protein